MLSVWTVGMALGALLLSRRVAAGAVAATGLAAVAVQGAGLALPALWLSFGFFLVCSFVGGLAHGLKNVMFRSLIHVRVPDHLHGRAFAAYNGIRNSAELGAFAAGGLLVAAIGAARDGRLRGRALGAGRADRAAGAGPPLPRLGPDRADRARPRRRWQRRAARTGTAGARGRNHRLGAKGGGRCWCEPSRRRELSAARRGASMGQPVVHFEVIAQDAEKLHGYYSELFGWEIDADNPVNYGIVAREGNTNADGIGIGGGVRNGARGL